MQKKRLCEERYKVYGLTLRSKIQLPELNLDTNPSFDVDIKIGEVPDHLPKIKGKGVLYEASKNDFLFKIEGIGRLRVQNGNLITIKPHENSLPEEIRLLLLGPTMGALLHQRGMLAIHGSAVNLNNTTTIITGKSGVGKSSLAAGLKKLGYSIIADDISVLSFRDKKGFFVYPGIPYLKLWKDVLKNLNHTEPLDKVRPQLSKYKMPFKNDSEQNVCIVENVVLLNSSNENQYRYCEISGLEKFHILRNNTYRLQFVDNLEQTEIHFMNLAKFVESVKLFNVVRPHTPVDVEKLANFVSEKIINR